MCKLYISSCSLFGTLFAFFFKSWIDLNDLLLSFHADFFHFIRTFVIQKWTEFQKHAHKSAVYFQNEYERSGQLLALYELVNCRHEHERLSDKTVL